MHIIGYAYSLTGRIQDIGVIMETRTVFSTKSKIKLRQPMEIAHDKVPFEFVSKKKCRLNRHIMCGVNWKQRLVVIILFFVVCVVAKLWHLNSVKQPKVVYCCRMKISG
jgi:hypothetical protein